MVDKNKIVGAISIRYRVDNDFLLSFGGYIGYRIKPSERNKGYGKEILKLGLITCLESNYASNKIITSCGGVFENKIFLDAKNDYMNRYWINL